MSEPLPPAGWYPAPHANNEQRFWDGAQWLDAEPVAQVPTALIPASAEDEMVVGAASPATAKRPTSKKKWVIAGSVVGGLIVIGAVGNALGAGNSEAEPQSTVTPWSQPVEAEGEVEAVEDPVVMVVTPDVAGMTAIEAVTELTQKGLTPPSLTTFSDPLAVVLSTSPAAGAEVEHGTAVTFTVEEKPKLTLAQQNVIRTAQSYLDYSGFSRTGLIGQLEYEGYSTEDATFGADSAGADWNAEAAESAQSYLDYSAFSREGLYDQLAYEGFSAEEIEFGLSAVGY